MQSSRAPLTLENLVSEIEQNLKKINSLENVQLTPYKIVEEFSEGRKIIEFNTVEGVTYIPADKTEPSPLRVVVTRNNSAAKHQYGRNLWEAFNDLKAVKSPHVQHILYFDSSYTMVSLFAEEFDLCTYGKSHLDKYSIHDVKNFSAQMILGLEALHKIHYVHGDIKPENYFLHGEEKSHSVKLADFDTISKVTTVGLLSAPEDYAQKKKFIVSMDTCASLEYGNGRGALHLNWFKQDCYGLGMSMVLLFNSHKMNATQPVRQTNFQTEIATLALHDENQKRQVMYFLKQYGKKIAAEDQQCYANFKDLTLGLLAHSDQRKDIHCAKDHKLFGDTPEERTTFFATLETESEFTIDSYTIDQVNLGEAFILLETDLKQIYTDVNRLVEHLKNKKMASQSNTMDAKQEMEFLESSSSAIAKKIQCYIEKKMTDGKLKEPLKETLNQLLELSKTAVDARKKILANGAENKNLLSSLSVFASDILQEEPRPATFTVTSGRTHWSAPTRAFCANFTSS